MTQHQRTVRLTLALAGALALGLGTGQSQSTPPKPAPAKTGKAKAAPTGPAIRIGAAFNLSGGLATLDAPALRGAQLAVRELNALGGVLGRPLELLVHDARTDIKRVPDAGRVLITEGKVDAVIGYTDTDPVMNFASFSEAAQTPFVVVGATSPTLRGAGIRVFLEAFGDNAQAAAGAEFVLNKLKLKSAYVLTDTSNTYTTGLTNYFETAFKTGGGRVLLEDTYTSGDRSFDRQIAKLKALPEKPGVIYLAALPDDVVNVVKSLRSAGFKMPIVGGDGYDTPDLLARGGESVNDVYFTTHILLDAKNGNFRAKEFIRKYKALYGVEPENAFAALGYDALRLVVNAMLRARSVDKDKVFKALTQTTNYGQITGSVSYSGGNRIPSKAVTVVQVKNGERTLAAEIVPSRVPRP